MRTGAPTQVPGWSCVVVDPTHVWKLHATRTGETSEAPEVNHTTGRWEKALAVRPTCTPLRSRTAGAVPMNHSNKDGKPLAENEEGSPLIKENTHQSRTLSTQSEVRVSQGLAGVRKAAKARKELKFTALLHHLTVGLLWEGFYALKRKAAPGVDGVTWEEYESGLEGRLVDLHRRVYRRRLPSAAIQESVYSEARWATTQPLGVAALEDKIVQHAVVTILNQIYEEDFRGFSYGFRPGRSQHQALDALYVAITRKKVESMCWMRNIRGFFDNLDRGWLLKFLQHRVADPRMLRLIQKWLVVGVMEEGEWKNTETGTPQGSGDFAVACQYLSALRIRPMGGRLA